MGDTLSTAELFVFCSGRILRVCVCVCEGCWTGDMKGYTEMEFGVRLGRFFFFFWVGDLGFEFVVARDER